MKLSATSELKPTIDRIRKEIKRKIRTRQKFKPLTSTKICKDYDEIIQNVNYKFKVTCVTLITILILATLFVIYLAIRKVCIC